MHMKKQELKTLNQIIKTGMPLSYFAKTEPFNRWFGLLTKNNLGSKLKKWEDKPCQEENTETNRTDEKAKHWTENVFLEKFQTKEIEKGIFKGCYEIYVEFSAYQKIVIALPKPKGTAAIFGKETKENEKPELLKLKFTLNKSNGSIQQVQISGDIKFRLPKSTISRVKEENYRWVEYENSSVEVPLSNEIITLNRGSVPLLSSPLILPNYSYRIAMSNMVAKISTLSIGGTIKKPKLVFNNIKLQTIIKH